MEFDYLPKSDIETGALRTEEQLKEAIRNLQRFGNIPVTGEIDAATRKLIRKPRCGVGDSNQTTTFSPDNLHHSHRMKRYVLQGPKWDKTDLTWRYNVTVNENEPNNEVSECRESGLYGDSTFGSNWVDWVVDLKGFKFLSFTVP
uniref:Peptidoglycan binding-like domain-containing protein n=1 Tax=Glossina brevipalpis TaxID=37001 RepID=A0A1A9W7U8_9MUSC